MTPENKKLLINVATFIFAVIIIHNIPSSWFGDAPQFLQHGFQDPATAVMEGVYLFNCSLLIVTISIVVLIAWLMFSIIVNFVESDNSQKFDFTHSNIFEIIWTSTPALILFSLAAPSFTLLYSLDEITNPDLTLKIFGHQWYWSYEISDFIVCSKNEESIKYTSYFLPNELLQENDKKGFFRILETNKRLILPSKTHIRLLITAVDVLHSWTVPSFGIKVDACPGRLNQTSLLIKRLGMFFGQCSEICGVNHAFMPIVVVAIPTSQFEIALLNRIDF
jgi:cytochrome c oxidase subunit 2